MVSVINQAGYAISALEFIPETPSLPVWLVLLTAFLAAMIAVEVARYHFSRKASPVADTTPVEIEYRKAA
jgi:hypothetical protein